MIADTETTLAHRFVSGIARAAMTSPSSKPAAPSSTGHGTTRCCIGPVAEPARGPGLDPPRRDVVLSTACRLVSCPAGATSRARPGHTLRSTSAAVTAAKQNSSGPGTGESPASAQQRVLEAPRRRDPRRSAARRSMISRLSAGGPEGAEHPAGAAARGGGPSPVECAAPHRPGTGCSGRARSRRSRMTTPRRC